MSIIIKILLIIAGVSTYFGLGVVTASLLYITSAIYIDDDPITMSGLVILWPFVALVTLIMVSFNWLGTFTQKVVHKAQQRWGRKGE